VICKPGVDCSTTKNPHDPNVIIAAVIGLVVGLIIGYFIGKSSTKAAGSTAQ
jgi:membrane protein DedA with SNARE-associated domain